MKKLLSLLILLGLFSSAVLAQSFESDDNAAANNPNAPKIEFKEETLDYGEIEKDSDGLREFVFTNTGKEPLIITNATGSCGCTVPEWPKEPIMPGQTGKLQVKYATNRVGAFNKTVTVRSNASNGTTVLRIKGTVLSTEESGGIPVKKSSMLEDK